MPSLQIDGVHLADLDAEDVEILQELARRGPGRVLMPPELSTAGKPEPYRTVEVDGEAVPVIRTDWLARLTLHFPEDQVAGERVEVLPEAANDLGRGIKRRAAA